MNSPNRETSEKSSLGFLRGGGVCTKCLHEKPDHELHWFQNRVYQCRNACRKRTPADVAREEAAQRAIDEQNRRRVAELNDINRAIQLGIPLADYQALRAEEAAEQARQEVLRNQRLQAWNREQKRISDIKEKNAQAQQDAKNLRISKSLITDTEINQINQRLYRNYGAALQTNTDLYVDRIKKLRKKYTNSWNLHNNHDYAFDSDSEPLWGDLNFTMETYTMNREPIPAHYRDLINKRLAHKAYYNRETANKIARKQNRRLYRGNSADDDVILTERNLITYSWDSINKNINTDISIPYEFSPNSIEIHCTTLKTQDVGVQVTDARGNLVPSNYFGHVTLNVIGPITKKVEKEIIRLGTERHKATGEPLYQCIEWCEKKHIGREYHYGMFIDPFGRRRERWWRTTWHETYDIDQAHFTLEEFPDFFQTYLTTHNSPMRLMLEYYLHCINTCPEEVVYTRPEQVDQTKLTYKDLTGWGQPKRIV
jgi:hypothetical protein